MTYTIKNNKLVGDNVEYHSTSKKSGTMKPRYLVIHYTAGRSFKGDVRTLSTSNVKASCQLVLSKEGKWAQIGNLNDIQWHAGKSRWDGLSGLNRYSIGIEVCCEGPVKFVKESRGVRYYRTWFGSTVNDKDDNIIEARHENGGPRQGWVQFTEAQIDALLEVGSLLMDHYNLKEAVGHDMIAPRRKTDPGPCMPDNVYSALNGRNGGTDSSTGGLPDDEWDYEVHGTGSTGLNIRKWPSSKSQIIRVLKEGEKLDRQRSKGSWYRVETEKDGIEGWVYSRYLKRI